jgi:pyruvate-formate lyase-activating enzyme
VNQLLYASHDGQLRVHRRLQAAARSGWDVGAADRLIPMPAGATLMHLPGRRPLGRSESDAIVEVDDPDGDALAVAAVLPPGYLRTWLPAYVEDAGAPVLPLYGYAAVASIDGEPHVAALPTDRWDAWNPHAADRQYIDKAIRAARRALPDSRLIQHLERCATEYRCLTAQNVFLRRGEGAIPVSPAWLAFAPVATEIAELAGWHLSAADSLPLVGRAREGVENFVSFGQGCEGEPLTRGAALVEATRRIHAAIPSATIHINTNGSRPGVLRRLVAAGLNSVRLSIFSLDDARFRAYYRPIGYDLAQVAECADVVAASGGQVTINLLTFPGISDAPGEIDRLVDFVHRHGVHQVQLRSLNVDPHWLLSRIPERTQGIGMRRFVRELRQRCPRLELGNFTRPWRVVEEARAGAS